MISVLRKQNYKDVSLAVFPRAISYIKRGHRPEDAFATSIALYAESFANRPLLCHGVMAQKEQNTVTVWDLHTETMTAQHTLTHDKWNFQHRSTCVARLGENYACMQHAVLTFSADTIIGIYKHRHRFIAVVGIKHEGSSTGEMTKIQKIADIVAKNALAYYPEYLEQKCQHDQRLARFENKANHSRFPDFGAFLLQQPLCFVENVNHDATLVRNTRNIVSIGDFISHHGEHLKQEITLAGIQLFGDFEHL